MAIKRPCGSCFLIMFLRAVYSFAAESIDAWMGAGLKGVQTEDLWLIHQTHGKPIPTEDTLHLFLSARRDVYSHTLTDDLEGLEAPAFGTSA